MAARKRTWTPQIVRERIRTSMLVHRLQKQAFDKIEISANGMKAIEILLRKALPDLSQVEHTASVDTDARNLSTDELLRRIVALEGASGPPPGSAEPSELH
jgi:hypothetical protein